MTSYTNPTVKHADILDRINRQNLPENYSIHDWKYILEHYNKFCFIATDTSSNTIIGYCICLPQNKTCDNSTIASIAIDPLYRNKGIATKLILQSILAIKKSNKNSIIDLHVRISNSYAIHLYKKFNFHIKGTVEKYYSNPVEDAYFLVKN